MTLERGQVLNCDVTIQDLTPFELPVTACKNP